MTLREGLRVIRLEINSEAIYFNHHLFKFQETFLHIVCLSISLEGFKLRYEKVTLRYL